MIDVYPSTYSPAALPSSVRAAPAKKRRLSAENGISSAAIAIGLPTFRDSSRASSSACSSSTSASLSRSSIRSLGVFSRHSAKALRAASTARSTSSALDLGTSAIASPVDGLSTSIVSPDAASTHSPPTKFLYLVIDTLTSFRSSPRRRPGWTGPPAIVRVLLLSVRRVGAAEPRGLTVRVPRDRHLAVPLRVLGEGEPDPGGVVRVVLLEEDPLRVRSRDEVVVVRVRDAREVDLLPRGGLVVLVDPADRDPLVARVAVEEDTLRCGRVVLELVPVDQAERGFDRVAADDGARRAALTDLEERHVAHVPVVVGRMELELAGREL